MIIGIGLDLASVDFWAEALQDPTTSVIEGTFTEQERADAARGPTPEAEHSSPSNSDRLGYKFHQES